jgi:hypothetical protein
MAFFGSKTTPDIKLSPDARNADAKADTKKTPEYQQNKLREQARSGGGWGGGNYGFSVADLPVAPKAEIAPLPEQEVKPEPIVLDLAPDANDKDMEHLLGILEAKGFYAVLKELDRIDNPHIEDDFHRLLVQYRKEGHTIPGLKGKHDQYGDATATTLFEVTVPVAEQQQGPGPVNQTLAEIITSMEQLYLALLPFFGMPDPVFFKRYVNQQVLFREHFTLELAVSDGREEAVFYVSVPLKRQDTFEKLVLALFPRARVREEKGDYNLFNPLGAVAVAESGLRRPYGFAIKTADGPQFHVDPMNVTLSAFSKLTREGEGAAIQILVAPAGEYFRRKITEYRQKLQNNKKGKSVNMIAHYLKIKQKDPLWRTGPTHILENIQEFFKDKSAKDSDDKARYKEQEKDPEALENIAKKLKTPTAGVKIRVIASARTQERADSIAHDVEATFSQYDDSNGNRFQFKRRHGAYAKALTRKFIWRLFDRDSWRLSFLPEWVDIFTESFLNHKVLAIMNVTELATVYHLTIHGGTSSREVKRTKSRQAPAPPHLPTQGILLGKNRYANSATDIYFMPEDRLRHLYTIGQTGTGKTTFLKNMIIQDIENGDGVCFIDPHGVDVVDILSRIPKERMDDVVYFDPAYLERPMGLNMLEYDPTRPEQKTFVVDEMFKIFKKLYGDVPEAFGPIFEQYFRNAAGLVVEDPETGSTLMDISRVLADEDFRHLKLSRSRNPVINHFWEDIAEQVKGEGDLRNVVPYITSKFDIFIANEIMRPIIGQQRSAFNFKEIMDNKKILLVNLSKGRLGDINANLIGLVLVGKIMMAALGRAEYLHTNPPPFYLYLDEFQNVTTDTIATILSEARKYRLSLTIAHQFIGQLEGDRIKESIKSAVFGNVGTMVIFRIGATDGTFLEPQFKPTFVQADMINLDNFNAYVKLLAEGRPVTPTFSMETLAFRSGDMAQIDAMKQMSYQRYGRPRDAVEEEIRQKYKSMHGK